MKLVKSVNSDVAPNKRFMFAAAGHPTRKELRSLLAVAAERILTTCAD